jgi:hypothetical protein
VILCVSLATKAPDAEVAEDFDVVASSKELA